MFGLEGQKKKKPTEEFVFDLEKTLKDRTKHRELVSKIEGQIQKVKENLRSGDSQQEFDRFGILLQGYTALLKVLARCKGKSK